MSKRLFLAVALALLPVVASAQLVPVPASPGSGLANSNLGRLSVIFGTTAGTAAQGNDSRMDTK
jgi:hypothetical protein